jgi:phospholipid/cholesterol/gamma-HCH transport system permease protein
MAEAVLDKSLAKLPKPDPFFRLPKGVSAFLAEIGGYGQFSGKFLKTFFRPPFEFPEVVKQYYLLGNKILW